MSVVYNREYVAKAITYLEEKGEQQAARLMKTLYEDVQHYKRDSEKAEGRLADIGIPGYGW